MQWFHQVIADHLDLVYAGKIKKLMIFVPPQHGKSELSTRSFPAYLLGRNPNLKLALISYNATLAEQFSGEIQRRIVGEEFKLLFPETRIGEKKGEAIRMAEFFQTVNCQGYVKAVGRGGSLTGTSVDIGIIDDPLKDRQEAQSSVIKEQLWNWYTDVFETRLHNGSAQVLIQTRWYDDDLAGRLLERDDDWTIIEFPAIREKAENSYDTRKEGEALWPEKHALEKLLRVKKNEPFTFESLYQQNPKPSVESLIYHDWQPCEFFPKDVDVLFSGLDFGFSNDPTALIRIAKLGNKLYLDEVIYQTGLTNSDLAKRIKLYPDKLGEIYADSADPKSIEELRREGLPIKKAVKGNDSVNAGISKLREYEVYYTRRSKNIKKEVDNYQWMMVGGKQINKPIDDFNHCFVGNTMVTTKRGQVPIKDVEVGDKVLTASGYKSVLIKHNNGLKQVAKYSLQLDTFCISLCCTNNHKIKTTKGWKKISELKQGMNLYLAKSLMERNITYMTMSDISPEEQKGYIELFGNTKMAKYPTGIIYTMWMKTLIIILLTTLILLEGVCILGLLAKKGLEIIQNLLKTFIHLVLRQQRFGTNQKKEDYGILSMVKNVGLIKRLKTLIAKFVVKSLNHDTKELSNIATTIVKLKHFEIEESWSEEVYDLTIEDAHEYFANGILVHNCMDAIRYAIYTKYSKKKLIIF